MPTEPPFESLVERQIRHAVARGEFDDLPGSGRPLDDVDSYDPEWWAKRFVRRERAREAADELRRKIRAELPRLRMAADRDAAEQRVVELNRMIEAANLALDERDQLAAVRL